MFKMPKQEYSAEFRELAVKRVKDGQAIGEVARDLGPIEQTWRNRVISTTAHTQSSGQPRPKRTLPVPTNLLDRHLAPTAPNHAWSADLTDVWTDEGWLYLAVILDLFSRGIVRWSIKSRMTTDIVLDALTMAWFRRRPAPGLIHHSERGSQYASHAFQGKLAEYEINCPRSRKGNC
jgi:putative transposase